MAASTSSRQSSRSPRYRAASAQYFACRASATLGTELLREVARPDPEDPQLVPVDLDHHVLLRRARHPTAAALRAAGGTGDFIRGEPGAAAGAPLNLDPVSHPPSPAWGRRHSDIPRTSRRAWWTATSEDPQRYRKDAAAFGGTLRPAAYADCAATIGMSRKQRTSLPLLRGSGGEHGGIGFAYCLVADQMTD